MVADCLRRPVAVLLSKSMDSSENEGGEDTSSLYGTQLEDEDGADEDEDDDSDQKPPLRYASSMGEVIQYKCIACSNNE